ncbi:hypothetical protein BJX66DRAFT_42259 [Aspergillus keveii]|uniref:Uncharacterized protein n=1 Tax=Aspergillus keveii TaxID=714993 RepID=A0ABR4FS25_9EURO
MILPAPFATIIVSGPCPRKLHHDVSLLHKNQTKSCQCPSHPVSIVDCHGASSLPERPVTERRAMCLARGVSSDLTWFSRRPSLLAATVASSVWSCTLSNDTQLRRLYLQDEQHICQDLAFHHPHILRSPQRSYGGSSQARQASPSRAPEVEMGAPQPPPSVNKLLIADSKVNTSLLLASSELEASAQMLSTLTFAVSLATSRISLIRALALSW